MKPTRLHSPTHNPKQSLCCVNNRAVCDSQQVCSNSQLLIPRWQNCGLKVRCEASKKQQPSVTHHSSHPFCITDTERMQSNALQAMHTQLLLVYVCVYVYLDVIHAPQRHLKTNLRFPSSNAAKFFQVPFSNQSETRCLVCLEFRKKHQLYCNKQERVLGSPPTTGRGLFSF